jgi:hypothetical protein
MSHIQIRIVFYFFKKVFIFSPPDIGMCVCVTVEVNNPIIMNNKLNSMRERYIIAGYYLELPGGNY